MVFNAVKSLDVDRLFATNLKFCDPKCSALTMSDNQKQFFLLNTTIMFKYSKI